MATYALSTKQVSPYPQKQRRIIDSRRSNHAIHSVRFLSILLVRFLFSSRRITTEATVCSLEHAFSNTSPCPTRGTFDLRQRRGIPWMRNVIPWSFLFRRPPLCNTPPPTILSHRVPTSLYFWQSTGPRKLRPFDRPNWITNDIKTVLVHEIRRFPTVSLVSSPSFAEEPPPFPWSTISFGVSCLPVSFQGCLSRGADNEACTLSIRMFGVFSVLSSILTPCLANYFPENVPVLTI